MKNMVVLLLICISIPAFAVEPTRGMVGNPDYTWCAPCGGFVLKTAHQKVPRENTAVDTTPAKDNFAPLSN